MPKLPDFTALGEREAPQLPRRTPMVAQYHATTGFEGAGAQALEHSGAELQTAAAVMIHAKEQHDTLAAEDAFNQLRKTQMDLTYGPKGFINLKGADTQNRDVPAEYGGQLNQAIAGLSSGLANDYQRQLFVKRAATSQLQVQEQSWQHVAQQSDVYANEVLKGTVETESRLAAAGGDVPISLSRINAAIDRHAQRYGLPEVQITGMKMGAADSLWSSKVKSLIYTDPMAALSMYREHQTEIGPQNRIVLEHEIKTTVQPIQAKSIADYIISGRDPAGLPTLQRVLDVGGEGAIVKVSQELDKEREATPLKTRDTRGMLAGWIGEAERVANSVRPNDPMFRDMVVQQVKGHVSTILAMQQGIQVQAQGVLITAASGGAEGKGPKPLTLDALFQQPGAREAYAALDPQAASGIRSLIAHNASEAERGTPIPSNAKVVRGLFERIHLADEDPRKINSPAQLTQFFGQGINRTDYDWLKRELNEQQSVGGRNFTSDVERVRQSARSMLLRSITGGAFPDKAEEAAYRFNFDLQQKIDQYRKDGKDPRTLLTPGEPDYALKPERVSSFMPKASAALSETAKLPKVTNDADFDALPPGTVFIDPKGKQRTKPGGQ